MWRNPILLAALWALTNGGSYAFAKESPNQQLLYRWTSIGRYNPWTLDQEWKLLYRKKIYRSEALALRDNFFSVGVIPAINPIQLRTGILAEVQPVSFLRIFARWEYVRSFQTERYFQSFQSRDEKWSDHALLDRSATSPTYSTHGSHFWLGASLLFRTGYFVARSQLTVVRGVMRLRTGDRYYYDLMHDALVENGGWLLNHELDLLFQGNLQEGPTLGVRVGTTHPFSSDLGSNPNGPMWRAGPIVSYTFFTRDGALFQQPTLFFATQWWFTHRFRAGADVNRLIPSFWGGLTFSGEIWRK